MGERLQVDIFLLPDPFLLTWARLVVMAVFARAIIMATIYMCFVCARHGVGGLECFLI